MMGVKTLVLLALVLSIFCIGFSHGIKCYQCEEDFKSNHDGGKCHRADESYLKECGAVDGNGGKVACLEIFTLGETQRVVDLTRKCTTEPQKDSAICKKDKRYDYRGEITGGWVKNCTCYEDGCNKTPTPGFEASTSNSNLLVALPPLLILLDNIIHFYSY